MQHISLKNKKNILDKNKISIVLAPKNDYIIGMKKVNEKKIARTHKFHPEMLKLINKCAGIMRIKRPFTFIEIAIIKEAERIDVISPPEIEKYFHICNVKI